MRTTNGSVVDAHQVERARQAWRDEAAQKISEAIGLLDTADRLLSYDDGERAKAWVIRLRAAICHLADLPCGR